MNTAGILTIRQPLTMDQLPKSVFATKPADHMSDRYSFVPTVELVQNFQKLGWYPVKAQERKSKKDGEYAKHMIRFAPANSKLEKGGLIPEIIVLNSHNGTSQLRVSLGIFRVVCSNGLVIADTSFADFFQKHINVNLEALKELILNVIEEFNKVYSKIEESKKVILNGKQQLAFAEKVVEMVWNEKADRYEAKELIKTVRPEDNENDLFTVMNVIQEHIMKGGVAYKTKKGTKKSKAVKSVDRDLNINIMLWGLMNQYMQTNKF